VNALFGCLFLKSGGGSVEAIVLSGLQIEIHSFLHYFKLAIFIILVLYLDEGCAQEKRVKGDFFNCLFVFLELKRSIVFEYRRKRS
jgi:hypothetical protein